MFAAAVLSIGLSVAAQAGPLTSGCERCHLGLHGGSSEPHVTEWTVSEHAARRVGCVRCHDGDTASDEPLEAHRFVLSARVRTSPIHRMQLPATCGQCHPREATQFTASRHGALLASGVAGAPSCATCHGSMSARIPSPVTLQATCAACHLGPGGTRALSLRRARARGVADECEGVCAQGRVRDRTRTGRHAPANRMGRPCPLG